MMLDGSDASRRAASALLVVLGFLWGCTGGETHWQDDDPLVEEPMYLQPCGPSVTCGAGLECICGICTLACSETEPCPTGRCTEREALVAASACFADIAPASICMATCVDDLDCSSIHRGHVCEARFCTPWSPVDDSEVRAFPSELVFPALPPGDQHVLEFQVENTDEAPLRLTSIAFYESDAFSTTFRGDLLPVTLDPGKRVRIPVRYAPQTAGAAVGTVVVELGGPERKVVVPVRAPGWCGTLVASPSVVDLGQLSRQTGGEREVVLRNEGVGALTLTGVDFDAVAPFVIEGLDDLPLELPPSATHAIRVSTAWAPGPMDGALVVETLNDCGRTSTLTLPLQAEGPVPCLRSVPSDVVDLGRTTPGRTLERGVMLENCAATGSDAWVEIDEVRIEDPFARLLGPVFRLSMISGPVRIRPGERLPIALTFEPTGSGSRQASLVVRSNAENAPELRLRIHGEALDTSCPTPSITCTGDVVRTRASDPGTRLEALPPGTRVRCSATVADDDFSLDGAAWSVTSAPPLARPDARPEGGVLTFQADAMGRYTVQLRPAADVAGETCMPTVHHIEVRAEAAMAIELLWRSETNASVELRLLDHRGRWGEAPWEVSRQFPAPVWPGEDAPLLEQTRPVAPGPERITWRYLTETRMRVGIHLRPASSDDALTARATALVNIWNREELIWQATEVPLSPGAAFVEIADLEFPAFRVVPLLRSFPTTPGR